MAATHRGGLTGLQGAATKLALSRNVLLKEGAILAKVTPVSQIMDFSSEEITEDSRSQVINHHAAQKNLEKKIQYIGNHSQVDSWIAGKAGTEISASQKQDPDIALLYSWLERGTDGTQAELALASPVAKKLIKQRNNRN
ncbi:hypothetical protein PoB_001292500 [Plakobranchus ocellatus]|uniref:Uncharacterized protein n=1 Tax=Plakobranchus ocellatus TaxID=259542 RepID=A0AAV3YTC2_9GAST|nr:hypothetical protein PoB_001292500 [Plakobranchus ocellatus]